MIECPYCGTENPADAKECHNCFADLTSLTSGKEPVPSGSDPTLTGSSAVAESSAPPPESIAPTMISSSAEVATMLAAAKGSEESEPQPVAEETPTEAPASEEPEPIEETPATPDYAAPTMMSSSAEFAAMLAGAEAEGEAASEPESPSEPETGSEPPAEVPLEIVESESPPMDTPSPELYAPTLISIPDPLGSMDSDEPPAPQEESQPEPKFKEIPTPLFNERVDVSTSSTPSPSTSETSPKKDNRLLYALAGCGCLSFACICVIALYFVFQIQA